MDKHQRWDNECSERLLIWKHYADWFPQFRCHFEVFRICNTKREVSNDYSTPYLVVCGDHFHSIRIQALEECLREIVAKHQKECRGMKLRCPKKWICDTGLSPESWI